MYRIEKKVGVARGKGWKDLLSEGELKRYVAGCEEIQNRMVYVQKQHKLLIHFEKFLRNLNDELKEIGQTEHLAEETQVCLGGMRHKKVAECLENMRIKLCNIDDNIDSSLRRAEASSALLNNLMNYQTAETSLMMAADSKTMTEHSIRIAERGDQNSRIGTAIAFTTFVFLPATAVATFFSMSMFDFPGESKRTVSSKFWIFWAVEIPLNVVLLSARYFWIDREKIMQSRVKKRSKVTKEKSDGDKSVSPTV